MNEITGYVTVQGKFVFVDRADEGYQEKFQAALVEALELAMGPATDIQFKIADQLNQNVQPQVLATDTNYVASEE